MEVPQTKRFGRYEVLEELGRGAMGVVYKARDPQIDRLVAVKTVSLWGQEPDEEKEFRLRFLNEAQAAGRLHHSGIVGVFDVGEDPDNRDPYIVLEYVHGETLNRMLARENKLPLEKALQLTCEIAEALDYAHAQGVIHRDVKPANILVTQEGHAKIADFGIAKLNLAHFTVPGRVLGTPAYMAPEQLSGEAVDGRSDLFSLGVILYAMVTGHSPFQGNSATTVCFKVANREPIAASALDLTLPPRLDAVIGRAMAKDPEERYQRGSEFVEDLIELREIYKPGSTTTSLGTKTGTRTRNLRTATTGARPATREATMAHAQEAVRHVFFKASVRDLIIGAATIAALVIIGIQAKLLVSSKPVLDSPPPVAVAPPPVEARPAAVRPRKTVSHHTQSEASSKKRAPKLVHASETVVASSILDLAVQHQFKDATLYVWVDDKLALTRPLHGAEQKKLGLFGGVHGVDSESLKIPAGKHALRFRALSTDRTVDLSKTISAEFVGGDSKSLLLTFDRHNTGIHTTWQ